MEDEYYITRRSAQKDHDDTIPTDQEVDRYLEDKYFGGKRSKKAEHQATEEASEDQSEQE